MAVQTCEILLRVLKKKNVLNVFGYFPMISEDSPKFFHMHDKHFQTFSEDFQIISKEVLITLQQT